MLYALHEYAYYTASPLRLTAQMVRDFWGSPANPASDTRIGRTLYAYTPIEGTKAHNGNWLVWNTTYRYAAAIQAAR